MGRQKQSTPPCPRSRGLGVDLDGSPEVGVRGLEIPRAPGSLSPDGGVVTVYKECGVATIGLGPLAAVEMLIAWLQGGVAIG